MGKGRGLSASSWHMAIVKQTLSVVCLLWLTGSKSPVHLMFSQPVQGGLSGITSAKPRYKMKFHLPSTPGGLQFAQRLSQVFTTDLKLSPECDVAVPECQQLTQLETFPTEEWCMEKAEHKRQNMHTEQSAMTAMNPCLKSRPWLCLCCRLECNDNCVNEGQHLWSHRTTLMPCSASALES